MAKKKIAFLDVDNKLLEQNLLITDRVEPNGIEQYLKLRHETEMDAPWKVVTPKPGFCVKTSDTDNSKVFVNMCHVGEIPEPKQMSDQELVNVWQTDEVTDYRVPISIQEPHEELDKSGKPSVVYDVAINTNYCRKLEASSVHRKFVVQVAFEGIENKFDVSLKKDGYVILKNRKCLGYLRPHRIRSQKGPYEPPRKLIEELSSNGKKPKETVVSSRMSAEIQKVESAQTKPQYRLLQIENPEYGMKYMQAEFFLPTVMTWNDVSVDIGQDRIIVEARRGGYLTDLFLPFHVDQSKVSGHFLTESKILKLTAPITDPTTSL